MSDIFLISDTHFNHAAMLTFTRGETGELARPGYLDIQDMNEKLICRWNERVSPKDHVYHLGDVGFGSSTSLAFIIRQLNGTKRLVRGNHDKHNTSQYIRMGFKEIYGMRLLFDVWLTHPPIHPSSMGRALGNAHGHIHAMPSPPGPYLNLCVEINGGYPQSLDVVREGLVNKQLAERGIELVNSEHG